MTTILDMHKTVLDSKGTPLFPGAIVQIIGSDPKDDPGPFSKYRGVVLSPHEETGDQPQYSVPVFFFQEVADYYFWHSPDEKIILQRWEKDYAIQLKAGDSSFLFADKPPTWESFPRVRFFMPTELMICEGFTAEDMISRLFGNNYHNAYSFENYVPKDPRECICSISGCPDQATNLTHYNVWGFIHPTYMCAEHHTEWNGAKTDGPPLKGLCLLDGTPVTSLKK